MFDNIAIIAKAGPVLCRQIYAGFKLALTLLASATEKCACYTGCYPINTDNALAAMLEFVALEYGRPIFLLVLLLLVWRLDLPEPEKVPRPSLLTWLVVIPALVLPFCGCVGLLSSFHKNFR